MDSSDVSRRAFMKLTAATGAYLAIPSLAQAAVASSDKMVGIQIGAISFVDEGTEKVLDILQEGGGVNTLFLAVFTYGRGIADRQIPGYPLPDHGKQVYDLNYHAATSPRLIRSTTQIALSSLSTLQITAISTSWKKSSQRRKSGA
jgi:hypothetical protein